MRRSFFIFCAISLFSSLFAAQNNTDIPPEINMHFAKDYFGKGIYTPKIANIVKMDEHFKKANDFLNNRELAVKMQVDANGEKQGPTRYLPNYDEAMKELLKSVNVYANPVSAYEFRYIAKAIYGGYGLLKPEYKNALPKVTKILVDNRVCEAYIDYGRELEEAQKKSEALEFYKKGMKDCSNIPWITNIFAGRIAYLSDK